MKAVILARVSTKEQEDGHSLDAQIANLKLYAERKNLTVIEEFRVIESSTKGDRPEFARMIDFIKKKKERIALIVDTVDRLQRSFKETPILNDLLERDYLELHFVKEGNILTKDATSIQKFAWNIGVVVSQSYTDQISDNVKRSVKHKISNGEWSGQAPLGYLNVVDPDTGRNTIVPDPERAFLIKKLFQEYATGVYSQAEIARKAKDWGLRSRKGNVVSPQSLHDLLQNPFYYGCMRIKGQIVPHVYTPLIDKALFDTCEAIRTGRHAKSAVKENKEPFLFRGLIRCAISGRTVSCDLKKGKYIYLICRDPESTNKKIWVKEQDVLNQIKGVFKSIQIPADVLAEILDSLRKTHEAEKEYHHAAIKALHDESKTIDRMLDNLTDRLLDESITRNIYTQKLTQLSNRRQEINLQLEQHHSGNEQFKIALGSLVTLASHAYEIFESSTNEEKRELIGYVFSNLQLEGAKLRYTLSSPFDLFVDLDSYQKWLPGPDSNQRPSD